MMKVEIWSDFVCPFCYIGKRQFEIGLEQFKHKEEVEVLFRNFQLDPYAKKKQEWISIKYHLPSMVSHMKKQKH
nr:DsbA family protein [Paenibacillus farraposensis]